MVGFLFLTYRYFFFFLIFFSTRERSTVKNRTRVVCVNQSNIFAFRPPKIYVCSIFRLSPEETESKQATLQKVKHLQDSADKYLADTDGCQVRTAKKNTFSRKVNKWLSIFFFKLGFECPATKDASVPMAGQPGES